MKIGFLYAPNVYALHKPGCYIYMSLIHPGIYTIIVQKMKWKVSYSLNSIYHVSGTLDSEHRLIHFKIIAMILFLAL